MSIKQMEQDLGVTIKGLLYNGRKTIIALENGIENVNGINSIYSDGYRIVSTEEYIFIQEV